jgi:CBS domain-containing protein
MNASDIMTLSVLSVEPDTSVLEAARLMLDHRISGLPVVDTSGALVGIVTEGDFLRRAEIGAQPKRSRWSEFFTAPGPLAAEYIEASGGKVRDIMTTQVHTVRGEALLSEIAQLMHQGGIKRVPVLRGRQLVGIVTRADLMRAIVSIADEVPPAAPDDATIHQQLLAELKKQPWAVPLSMFRFEVKDGAVEFSGVVRDERQRKALRVAAENIPGVKAVEDRRLRFEPVIGLFAIENED